MLSVITLRFRRSSPRSAAALDHVAKPGQALLVFSRIWECVHSAPSVHRPRQFGAAKGQSAGAQRAHGMVRPAHASPLAMRFDFEQKV